MMLLIAGCSIASVHLVLLYFALYPAERPTEEFRQIVDRYLGVASGERVEISLMGQSVSFASYVRNCCRQTSYRPVNLK